MTIDERAAACSQEVMRQCEGGGCAMMREVITRHLREAVAERDALLREADGLFEMGVWYGDYKARSLSGKAEMWEQRAQEVRDRIVAMIGEQA